MAEAEAEARSRAHCLRDLLRDQAEGLDVPEELLRVYRREEDLVRCAIHHPQAFRNSGVYPNMFRARDYQYAWRAIERLIDVHQGDGPLPFENVLAEMRCMHEKAFAGQAGNLWMLALRSEQPVGVDYALEVLANEVQARAELQSFRTRFNKLHDRIESDANIIGLHQEYVTEAIRVSVTPDGGRLGRSMEEIYATPVRQTDVVPTLIPQLDAATGGGLGRGEWMTVGGGTNHGKSYFGNRLARNQARAGRSVLCLSIEDPEQLFFCRMLADYSPPNYRLSPISIRKRLQVGPHAQVPGAADWRVLQAAYADLAREQQGRVIHFDAKKWTVGRICSVIRRHRYVRGVDMVIIDYLQAILPNKESNNKTQDVSYIVSELKKCADECRVAMVVMSQYARDQYRDGQEPGINACKYAGDIENESEVLALLWKDDDDVLHCKLPKIKWVKARDFRYIIQTDPETGSHLDWIDDFAPSKEAEPPPRTSGRRGGH